MERLYALASYLINARGYLVIGDVWGVHDVGQTVDVLWNVDVDQPLRIVAQTTIADWKEQSKVAAQRFQKDWRAKLYKDRLNVQRREETKYFRVVTD